MYDVYRERDDEEVSHCAPYFWRHCIHHGFTQIHLPGWPTSKPISKPKNLWMLPLLDHGGVSSSSTSSSPSIPVASTDDHREVDAFLVGATNSAADIDRSFSYTGLSSDDDDDDDDSVSGQSICKKIYLESGNSKNLLLAMAIGLTDEDDSFGNTSNEPYKSSTKRKHFVP
eukprot:scaffold22264_cov49-Attheya_sp.AAC.1